MEPILHLVPQRRRSQVGFDDLVELTVVAVDARAKRDVLVHGLGKGVGSLEHHPHPATQGVDVHPRAEHVGAAELDLPLDSHARHVLVHTIEAAQQRRLSAARGPDQCGDRAGGDVEGDLVEGLHRAVPKRQVSHAKVVGHDSVRDTSFTGALAPRIEGALR